MATENVSQTDNPKTEAQLALLVQDGETARTYQGAPEALVAAGILTPELLPPIGRGSVTFYDGQPVTAGGWVKLADGTFQRAEQNERYVQVKRRATGELFVIKGVAQPRSEPAFKAFLSRTLQPVDHSNDAPAGGKSKVQEAVEALGEALAPLDQLYRDVIGAGLAQLVLHPEKRAALADYIDRFAEHGRAV